MLTASTVSTAKIWIAAAGDCAFQGLDVFAVHDLHGDHCQDPERGHCGVRMPRSGDPRCAWPLRRALPRSGSPPWESAHSRMWTSLLLTTPLVSTARMPSAATAECAYQDLEFLDAHGLQGEHCQDLERCHGRAHATIWSSSCSRPLR